MNTHYLESAITSFAHAIVREYITKKNALEILEDLHTCGTDDAQKPLHINLYHDCVMTATHYEFYTLEPALDAAIANVEEFTVLPMLEIEFTSYEMSHDNITAKITSPVKATLEFCCSDSTFDLKSESRVLTDDEVDDIYHAAFYAVVEHCKEHDDPASIIIKPLALKLYAPYHYEALAD